jgi:hypothetical protein
MTRRPPRAKGEAGKSTVSRQPASEEKEDDAEAAIATTSPCHLQYFFEVAYKKSSQFRDESDRKCL